ncbi:hypothetical protein E4U09_002549 [Claviceps aff. purpurea]|uniref:Uncharacterized protein n=1 Tax=Claviceps aff. purpurea TaxID=1967640 RepID=A0A9P7QFQ4_9HYPO|nr:hypothetical protein E4U09_002549 [Claviceps aff. purpurea]
MLDANLPTYTHRPSENPLHTFLFYTYNGSEPSPAYLLKRPPPSVSRSQYALGLLDVHCPSVVYAEVLIQPIWTQPTLSAAELRASSSPSGSPATPAPLVPDSFDILLYNPDQRISVKRIPGSWGKSETWEFEVPERTFRMPSASEIDRDAGLAVSDLAPKVVFRWKRDGRLSRDMSCYMCGSSLGGTKSKEPDITVAMFRAAKSGSIVTVYEPNMARVAVEDRKGLEVALLLGAEVVRDLYLVPRHDPFNTGGGGPTRLPSSSPSSSSPPPPPPPQQQQQQQSMPSKDTVVHPRPGQGRTTPSTGTAAAVSQAQVDAETKRLQAMVADEKKLQREREQRDREEQDRIRKMLREEQDAQRQRREAEVEQETERLRRQYGVQQQPPLPPRPVSNQVHPYASGGLGGGQQQQQLSPATMPPRPNSTEPPSGSGSGAKKKHSGPLSALLGPYGGVPGATMSGFFHRLDEDKKKKRVQKKRSL